MVGKTVATLASGESGWTVPWAVRAADDDTWWILGDTKLGGFGGTASMKVQRFDYGLVAAVFRQRFGLSSVVEPDMPESRSQSPRSWLESIGCIQIIDLQDCRDRAAPLLGEDAG